MELALRASHMNLSDAIDSLDGGRGGPMDPPLWGNSGGMPGQGLGGPRHGGGRPGPPGQGMDHDFDLPALGGPMGHPLPNRGGGGGGGGYPNKGYGSGGNSLMNNVGGGLGNNPLGGGGGGGINPSLLQRILNQQGPNSPQAVSDSSSCPLFLHWARLSHKFPGLGPCSAQQCWRWWFGWWWWGFRGCRGISTL